MMRFKTDENLPVEIAEFRSGCGASGKGHAQAELGHEWKGQYCMRFDEPLHTGERGAYRWAVARQTIPTLRELVVDAHLGRYLCITAFDGGVVRPTAEETALGWTMSGEVMVSPPIDGGLDVPRDEYDEWYILSSLDIDEFDGWQVERFVNYGGFTLADADDLYRSFDSSWDRHGLDYLRPIQERFWNQLNRVRPISYVAMGDHDVVVSRDHAFIERLIKAAMKDERFRP